MHPGLHSCTAAQFGAGCEQNYFSIDLNCRLEKGVFVAVRFFAKIIIVFLACAALSACAGSMPWDKKPRAKSEDIKVTSNKSVTQAPVPQGYGGMSAGANVNYGAMASNPDVEVYNLDTGAPYGGGGETIPSGYVSSDYQGGAPLASDPSVTVYPVDGSGFGEFAPIASAPPAMGLYNPEPARSSQTGGPVSSVYFDYGSAQINDPNALRSVAEAAKFAPVERVVVEGHASPQTQADDPVEARILNLRESLKRAEAVSKTLIEEGVPAEKIKTVGWGDTKLSGGAEEQQRRVDIITAPGAGL